MLSYLPNKTRRPLARLCGLLAVLAGASAGAGPNDALHVVGGLGYGHDDNLLRVSGQPGEIKGLLDCGPLGYLGIAAHGHADALALTLSVAGEECLVDPGTNETTALCVKNYNTFGCHSGRVPAYNSVFSMNVDS